MSAGRINEPDKFVDGLGAFSLDGADPPAVRPLEDAPSNVLDFSEFSRPETIRSICHQNVPGWSAYPEEKIAIDQICEGLSNQLFKVHLSLESSGVIPCVLFRIYGKDVATLYDQESELATFKTLSTYQIAPKMYAHGPGWRLEEWHFAVPLKTRYMRNPSIMSQVASQLGRLHKLPLRDDFPKDVFGTTPASLSRLQSWSDGCKVAAEKLEASGCNESHRRLARLNIPEMVAEKEWLRSFVLEGDQNLLGSGLDIVFSHNDVQENNILQTQYGLRFIDFEYSSMDYQAYDIASYFIECMIDYCHDKYPFYLYTNSDYPSEWEQRLFCSIYLSEYFESKVKLDDSAVSLLLSRVQRFTLLSHYLWAVWSVIRAPQAATFNEFDFLGYAQTRWDAYKRAKHALIQAESPLSRMPSTKGPVEHYALPLAGASPPISPARMRQRKDTLDMDNEKEREKQQKSAGELRPMLLGSALTLSGVVMGALAVVVATQLARR